MTSLFKIVTATGSNTHMFDLSMNLMNMFKTEDEIVQCFVGLGLSEQKAKETYKNANVRNILTKLAQEVAAVELPVGAGILLYHLATKTKPQINDQLSIITKYIATTALDSTLRVDKAIEYCLSHVGCFKLDEFEKACGVGIKVTPEQIEKCVEKHIAAVKNELMVKRYKYNSGLIMQNVRKDLTWADGKAIKSEVDLQIFDLLGPKSEADLAPVPKTDKKIKAGPVINSAAKQTTVTKASNGPLTILEVMKKVNFHVPGDNYKTDGYVLTPNTRRLLEEHLKITEGKVRTRFPPEPNGILHIGHAKAININFGYAAAHGGICFLRYDDTNPEKEEEQFFTGIRDMVSWLGYTPHAITHSSDYFDQLYEWAEQLIGKGLAYVCHQTTEEMRGYDPAPSPWRDRPAADSLQLFRDMRHGKVAEGAATLRLRVTLEEGKQDPVAYRVRFTPHHRTGTRWCVYPTYDFTHCLCDSLEHITHSLCTKEFQSRRTSYYWLCNALDLYCPVQWEYGRLNVHYTVVSKRKIARLIQEGIVHDWDDPRLYTLTALRRRGFPPEAVNHFCAQLGVTGAQSVVDPAMLEAYVRDHLNNTAPRVMVVLDPLKVTITNYPHSAAVSISVPDFPHKPELGSHQVAWKEVIYIDRSDFMETGDKGYRRLTRSQSVGLRHAGVLLEVTEVEKDDDGVVVGLRCSCTSVEQAVTKPKAFIHWVAKTMAVEVRIYRPLFEHKNPEDPTEVPGGFLSDITSDSLTVVTAFTDRSMQDVQPYCSYQFERIGFFSVDPDSTREKIVFNQTVGLKEDTGKQ